ncbi:hypothetical protein Ahy_A03g010204 isoform D [Arachis hypogaea]|uniref:Uncharacterized protein n=1 Tax=Arachis hypogaea TaxID=3818 RepID=A0A445DLL0_ARAHY|nr:hypothetical protein Ahy_A03g010204 isoform D [Arachis hypogaea]
MEKKKTVKVKKEI